VIIADTGFWIALADKKDRHHQAANAFVKNCSERLITTYPVITEVCHLLHRCNAPAHRYLHNLNQAVRGEPFDTSASSGSFSTITHRKPLK
jgi:predicted nucleic acid-binding protein